MDGRDYTGNQSIVGGSRDVFEVCGNVELAAAELYHLFADIFKDDRELFLLWLKMALEEENHARLFALLGRLRRANVIESIKIELVEAEVALLFVRSLIGRVKKSPPSFKEALSIALDLEEKFDGFISKVVTFTDPAYERQFLAINGADTSHLELLQKARAGLLTA